MTSEPELEEQPKEEEKNDQWIAYEIMINQKLDEILKKIRERQEEK